MEQQPTIGSPKGVRGVVRDALKELGTTVVAFVKAPKALWGVNVPYVIEGLVYFGILTILGKFCSENLGLSDLHAGWVYSAATAGITLAMLFLGGVVDRIGVPKTLALSFVMFVLGRGVIALSGTLPLGHGPGSPMFFVMCGGLLIAVVAYGLYQPAAYAGVKRYTNPRTAAMGYAVVYGLMNLGAFLSGFVSPAVRRLYQGTFPPNGLTAVFWSYSAFGVVALVITLLILTRKTDEAAAARVAVEAAEQSGERKAEDKVSPAEPPASTKKVDNTLLVVLGSLAAAALVSGALAASGRLSVLPPWLGFVAAAALGVAAMSEFLRWRPDHPFRDVRFVFFIFILIPVQTLFAHNWLTIPYYLDRAFQGSVVSTYFEFFSNLNPILIFVLAPLVAGLTARTNVYKMMIIGTAVMAAPTFLLATGPRVVPFLAYVVLMSVGEAMWQPRFLQWIAEIAPPDKTGMYMGIGQFPWFLTKFATGLYSGYFVEKYIPRPDTGLPTHTELLWLVYALVATITPVALFLARGWMKKGMREKHQG